MSHHHEHTSLEVSFWQLWDPVQIVFALGLLFLYIKAVKSEGNQPISTSQKIFFVIGIALYMFVAGGPVNYYGHHYLLSAHMLQQSLLYYVVPPLLIFGTPKFVFQNMMENKWTKKLLETHLLISLLAFDLLFSMYHLPIVFNVVMGDYVIMTVTHLILFLFAVQMWWPIISPLPEIDQTSELRKMGYIVLGAVLITPACGLIIFASEPMYAPYFGAPQLIEILTPMDDQQLGGILMKVVQELSFGSILFYLFFRWYKKENSVDSLDMNPHQELAWANTGKENE